MSGSHNDVDIVAVVMIMIIAIVIIIVIITIIVIIILPRLLLSRIITIVLDIIKRGNAMCIEVDRLDKAVRQV